MVLYYCSEDFIILIIDVQTDPIKTKLRGTNMLKISVSDSKYHIVSEIRTPASPNTNCDSSLIKAHYYKTWRDKSCFERSCFRVLHDLLTKEAELRANTRSSVFSVKWEFAEKKPRPGNLNIQ